VIHLYDPRRSEQERGFPAFSHALENMKKALTSIDDEGIRTSIISRMHLLIFNESGGPDVDEPTFSQPATVDGQPQFSQQRFPGGIRYMTDGKERMEVVKHDNPGVTYESFQDRLFRDAIIGAEWSYNVWKGSGQGTDSRAEILKCRRAVVRRHGILWHLAKRAIPWAYGVFQAQGRIPKLQAPTSWDFSRPPRASVDDGREVKMELDQLRTGSMNLDEVLAARGIAEDDFIEKRARSVFMRKLKALKVAEELNAKHGTEIVIEDREMFMQTANEVAEQPTTTQVNDADSDQQ
jgi:capsid protein